MSIFFQMIEENIIKNKKTLFTNQTSKSKSFFNLVIS